MAEDVLYESISTKEGLTAGDVQEDTEPSNLLQKLRNRISKSVQSKVDSILGDVQKLSDYDKLYLYLQLPPGPSGPEKSLDVSSVTTAEHMHACTWIRNHLEEHTDTCLPKQDVYDAYNGLRRKSMVSMPPLPSLDLKMTESSELTDLVQSYNNDVIHASCALICNWAEKILKRSFNNVVEVAQFLIQQHIINPRSANAELVLSMVLSDNSQSSGQKIHKQPPDAAGSKRPGSPDSGAEVTSKNKTTNNLPSSPPQVKKRPPEPQKPANSPQVDALVARLPVLLPRLPTEEKYISSSPPVRFNPPVLAPNLIPGQLKVSPLPFTHGMPLTVTGVNGTGLVSQPVAPPVISMILPDMTNLESHALSKTKQNGSKDFAAAGSTADSKGTKRPAAAAAGMSTEEGPSRRKRGRPRKMDASPAKSSNQGNMAAGRVVMDGTRKDSDREASVLPRPFIPDNQLIVSHRTVDPMEATAGSDTKMAAETVPNQVSVIQDGRQSFAQWTVRPGDSQKQQQGSDKAPTIGQTE
ncbi:DNA-binding protein RFX5 isoform X2 [Bufo bufo]|uniref:DNA-binding protein RFX5 isoform X2 n=1 Tax=Bufo bufo TaxID=8384 RepID=UPI001ABDED62|nr:DNA-binding protein RFX5 isoform X2 [Bufo bufo]